MKKQIILGAFALSALVLGTSNVFAQTTNQATTAVNINLSDVITITGGTALNGAESVDFSYPTALAYNSDQVINKPASIIVTSNKNFAISVQASGASFLNSVATTEIPVDVLRIEALVGTSNNETMVGTVTAPITLSTTDQPLITNAALGSGLTAGFKYTIPSTESSSSKILGKAAGDYTINVTYTATAN